MTNPRATCTTGPIRPDNGFQYIGCGRNLPACGTPKANAAFAPGAVWLRRHKTPAGDWCMSHHGTPIVPEKKQRDLLCDGCRSSFWSDKAVTAMGYHAGLLTGAIPGAPCPSGTCKGYLQERTA